MSEQPIDASVPRHPLAHTDTVYAVPDGRRCVVTFANRGSEQLEAVRNRRGDLWVGFLGSDGRAPARWDDWERGWVPAELLLPVGRLAAADPSQPSD